MTPKEEAVYCLINVIGQYVNNPINRLVKALESRSKLPINKLKSQFECDLCNKTISHALNFEQFNKNYSIPILSQYVSDIKFFIEEKCVLRNSNIHLLGGVNELRWYAHNLISGKLSSYDAKVINYSNMIDYTLSLPYHSHNSRVLSAGLPNLAIYFHSISDGVLSKTQIEDITALGIWPEHFDGKNICIVLTGTNNSSKSKYIENKIRHQVENYCLLFEVKFLTLSENNTSEGCHKYELDGLVSLTRNFCIETKAESSEDSIGLSTVFLDRHKYRYLLKELPLEEKINYLLMLANFIPGRTSSTIRDIHDFLTLIGYYMEIDESAVEHVLDVIDSDEGLGISFTNKHKGSNLMSIFLFDALAGLAHCSDDKKRIITIVESALSNN